MGYDRDCASLFQRLLDPSCDYVDSKYRDGTMLVPSCILDDPLLNPNGLNDCVTGICYDDTSSSQYCNALEASQPGACSTYVQCQCIVPNEDWRPPSPPPPVDCSGLIPDGGRCGDSVTRRARFGAGGAGACAASALRRSRVGTQTLTSLRATKLSVRSAQRTSQAPLFRIGVSNSSSSSRRIPGRQTHHRGRIFVLLDAGDRH